MQMSKSNPYDCHSKFSVLHHTENIFIVQTHAGTVLKSADIPQQTSYGDFNLGLHVNDAAQAVLSNRAELLAGINDYLTARDYVDKDNNIEKAEEYFKDTDSKQTIPKQLHSTSHQAYIESIHWLDQIHGNQVVDIEHSTLSLDPMQADALTSKCRKKALAIMTADCVPIVLYHPITQQIAAIHAGWQGLANGVITNTLDALMTKDATMTEQSTDTQSIYQQASWQAWIGTCICSHCYEVSNKVVDKLLQCCQQLGLDTTKLWEQSVKEHDTDNSKAWLDIPTIAVAQLERYDVKMQMPLTIELEKKDTSLTAAFACSYHSNQYYSYRRMTHQNESNTGRMALLIMRL